MRLGELLSKAAKLIAASGSETPRLDAELILASVLGKGGGGFGRAWILAHPEAAIEEKDAKAFLEAAAVRAKGLSVAYITGSKFFWKHEFEVSRDVLVPKPDTEILVERAEEALKSLIAQKGQAGGSVRLLDACTGSGCVAISLKADFPDILAAGADISPKALEVAKRNAAKILAAKEGREPPVTWIACDIREGLPAPPFHPGEPCARWDIIAANPPYVPAKTARELLADGRGEPALALDGGADGLSLIRPLVFGAAKALLPKGFLLLEAGEYNIDSAAKCFKEAGFDDILVTRDLAGQKRVVEGRLAPD